MLKIVTDITIEDLLFAPSKAYDKGYLDVGDGHQLFYQQSGNPNGPCVLIVHGGPGSGIAEGCSTTRTHDPSFFRIIALDQRGCGKSIPHFADDPKRAVYRNTPDTLADDFEKLRRHLGVSKWHVAGISWGSCLGLYYAARYPQHVASLTLGGMWMHTPQEINWFINYMGFFHPEAEEKLLRLLPSNLPRFNRLPYLYKTITGKNKKHALKIAEAQGSFEEATLNFPPTAPARAKKPTAKERLERHRQLISLGALEVYFMQKHPLPPQWFKKPSVIKAILKIKDFHIVQGRYDIICPPTIAYDVHRAHPHSKLTIIQYTGHGILRETHPLTQWMAACERLKKISL